MKKSLKSTFVLLGLMLTATAFVGCSDENSGKKEPTTSASSSASAALKLTNLSYWFAIGADEAAVMKSLNDNTAYKEYEAKTGVKVEWQHPAQGQATEQFNLMVTTNQLPDVVFYSWRNGYPGGAEKAIKDKKIIPLNNYMQYAPNLKKIFDENPDWKKQATTDEGNIIGFPFIRESKELQTFMGLTIRKDWLDKLGLSTPTTLDEWTNVLKAFKERDPNGNGKADEVPIRVSEGETAIVGAFGINADFYREGNTVKYGPIQPEFKLFLTLMNQWYKDGLLDKDFATSDAKLVDAKVTGNQLGSGVMYAGSGIGKYMGLMASKEPNFKLVPVPYPTLKAGNKPLFGQRDNAVTDGFAAITSSNKNIIETVKWLDFAYGEEGHMIMNFGKEGVTYNMKNGYPTYADNIMKDPGGLPLAQSLKKNIMAAGSGPFIQDKRYMEQYLTYPEQKETLTVWTTPTYEKMMPAVVIANEDSSKYASIMNDVNTFKKEMSVKFIMGAESLDKFDDYVKTLKSMGIEEAIEFKQSALERYNNR